VTTRPFCFAWHWPGGGGHMMVARGAMIREELQFVAVNDPWPPCVGDSAFVAYGFYNTWPGDHTHWDDYYEVIPKP